MYRVLQGLKGCARDPVGFDWKYKGILEKAIELLRKPEPVNEKKELKEAKRLLKAAVEDINAAEACDTCEYYPIINSDMCQKDDCYKWRHADKALALIGEGGDTNG